MNKAFIFDMDGVIVDSERAWLPYEKEFMDNLFGEDINKKIGITVGMSLNTIYDKAKQFGFSMDKQKFFGIYDKQASFIYSQADLTQNIDILGTKLISLGFRLGLVSSSRRNWIDQVLPRLSFKNNIEYIISITDRLEIRPKPNPDGYKETIKKLGATPQSTFILEDSNSGIQAAKASGAYTIGFSGNLIPGYIQNGADVYANTMDEVIKIVVSREKSSL